MTTAADRQDRARTEAWIQEAIPSARIARVWELRGGIGARMQALTVAGPAGNTAVTLRRYTQNESMTPDRLEREYGTLLVLRRAGVPAPEPLLLDAAGERFGTPAMVMSYVPGRVVPVPRQPDAWLRELARGLALTHAVTPEAFDQAFLPVAGRARALAEVDAPVAVELEADAVALEATAALRRLMPRIEWLPTTLGHGDYWPANVVMYRGRLSGVIDWAGVRIDDPRYDVAQCRVDLALMHGPEIADGFLAAYERATGASLRQLAFFDLSRARNALRHLPQVDKWLKGYHDLGLTHITPEVAVDRCRAFLRAALTASE